MLLAALVLATSTWVRAQEPAPPQIAAEPVAIPCEFGNASARKYEVVDVVETFRGSESLGKYTMVRTFTERVAKRLPQGLLVHWSFGAPRFPDGRPKDDVEAELALMLGKLSKLDVNVHCDGRSAQLSNADALLKNFKKSIDAPRGLIHTVRVELEKLSDNPLMDADLDELEKRAKEAYVVTRSLQFLESTEDFIATFYPFFDRMLSLGVERHMSCERRILGSKEAIPLRITLTLSEIREEARVWIVESKRVVERPRADGTLDAILLRARGRWKRPEPLPIATSDELANALESHARYEIEMDSGWPRLVEHTSSRVDENCVRHQTTRTIRRIVDAPKK